MSLNRNEQMILDYVQSHNDERQFWQDKVLTVARNASDDHAAAAELELEIWYYFSERSKVAEPFKAAAQRDGLKRTSMRNLAEYWVRIWVPQRPKKKRTDEGHLL